MVHTSRVDGLRIALAANIFTTRIGMPAEQHCPNTVSFQVFTDVTSRFHGNDALTGCSNKFRFNFGS